MFFSTQYNVVSGTPGEGEGKTTETRTQNGFRIAGKDLHFCREDLPDGTFKLASVTNLKKKWHSNDTFHFVFKAG